MPPSLRTLICSTMCVSIYVKCVSNYARIFKLEQTQISNKKRNKYTNSSMYLHCGRQYIPQQMTIIYYNLGTIVCGRMWDQHPSLDVFDEALFQNPQTVSTLGLVYHKLSS